MTALQLVDRSETVVFDLDDPTGAANPHSLKTRLRRLDLGAPNRDASLFSPSSVPGAIRTRVKHGAVIGQAVLSVESTSSDLLLAGHGELARLLEMDGVALRLQADGQTSARLIEVADATLASLLRGGDREGFFRFAQFYDDELGITFVRQPFLRGTELDSDTNQLKNSTLLFDSNGDGRPDEWVWLVTTNITAESIDAPTESYKLNIATTAARSLQQQSAVGSFASGDVVTFSFYVKAAAVGVISARAAAQFYQADGTTAVGAENVGTLTDIGTSWTRITVTTSAAGASTSRATVSIRFENDAATDTAVYVRRTQLEVASAASSFVTSSEIVPNNPLVGKTQAPTPPVATDSGLPGLINTNSHSWVVTFVTAAGETLPSAKSNVVFLSAERKVDLVIPIGPSEVTARKIYRTVATDAGAHKLVATVADNTTTAYQDNTADASLGVAAPTANTTAVNNKIGRLYPVFIEGDAPTPVIFEITGDAEASIQSAHLASLSALEDGGKSLTRFLNSPPLVQCEGGDSDIVHTVPVAAGGILAGSVVADSEASNEQAVSYGFGGILSTYSKLLRVELTDTDDLEGYRGTFDWKLRLAATGKYHVELQLRWADSLEEPASFANLPVRHNTDLDGLASFGYVEINLGKTSLPTEGTLDGLALEVWGRDVVEGAVGTELRLDCLIPVPTEQSATVALPYTGRAIVAEDSLTANLGNKLGANTWRVTWRYSVQAPTSDFVIALRVRRDTQNTGTIIREFQKDHPSDITNVVASLEFDSLAAVTYFVDTDTFAGSATITIHEVIVEKVTSIIEDETLVTDPNLGVDRAYKLATTGRHTSPAFAAGPIPFWLPPGLTLVDVTVFEPRIGGLYSELKSELRRFPTLSHRYAPRYPA